jgi:glycosyltransferase involved in cell wall biosynthesis
MDCSIVIRAYNEEKHIGRLLDGIARQSVQDVEIILVDSGSTDRTVAIASGYPVKILHILPEEFSFGRSLNLGISKAQHESVVLASAHVYPVYPDWLERLIEPFAEAKVGLCYGKQRGNAESNFAEQQVLAHWFPDQSSPRQAHPFCNNANAAIRRSLWEGHPYDETLTGLEDLAWARWLIDQGMALAYIAEAEVIHVHNETAQGVYNRYRREAMAFKRLFPEQRFSLVDLARLVVRNIASDAWQAARQKSLSNCLTEIVWFRWMQFWGTYQGYRHPGPVTQQLRKTFYYPRSIQATSANAARNIEPIRYKQSD